MKTQIISLNHFVSLGCYNLIEQIKTVTVKGIKIVFIHSPDGIASSLGVHINVSSNKNFQR